MDKIVEDVKNIGTVQILVNNAGIYEPKAFQDITDEDWLRFFEVNVMSGVRFSRALLPPMLLLNWGRIIFVSSESAINIPKEMIHYGMTKTAQLAISRGLAELTKGTEVTVNTVAPGPTASEGVIDFVKGVAASEGKDQKAVEDDFFRTVRPTSLLQRFQDSDGNRANHRFPCEPSVERHQWRRPESRWRRRQICILKTASSRKRAPQPSPGFPLRASGHQSVID